jgi:nicotinamidase-related amidase
MKCKNSEEYTIYENIRKELYDDSSVIELSSLNATETALIIVDMINGFVHFGALSSDRINSIITPVSTLMKKCSERNIKIAAFADSHKSSAAEFSAFPPHCTEDSDESQIIPEIKNICNFTLIRKNSTNGFHAPDFRTFLNDNPKINTFIVCGDCTDICVNNFCITLKTYFDQLDLASKIFVPVNAVETFNAGLHDADFMNTASLFLMKTSGIDIVKEIL